MHLLRQLVVNASLTHKSGTLQGFCYLQNLRFGVIIPQPLLAL